MSKKFWDDDSGFSDNPVQYKDGKWQEGDTYTPVPDNTLRNSRPQAHQQPKPVAPQEVSLEELIEQVSQEDDEEDFESVLSDARLRLEQGKLYEMVMQHDLFSGLEVDPRATKSVQKQIRKFAQERMEIMLGMRQEKDAQNTIVSSPFNDTEVTVLKMLAEKASGGLSKSEEANRPHPVQTTQVAKKTTINTIGSKPKALVKPVQKKVEPLQRPKVQAKPLLPPEMEPDYEPLDKPIHEMTAAELAERDKQALERQKNRKSAIPADRAPMPDYATMEMIASSQVNKAVGNPQKGNLSAMIMANLKGAGKI